MPALPSPGLIDHRENRKSACRAHLAEVVKSGDKYGSNMRLCAFILDKIEQIEKHYPTSHGATSRSLHSSESKALIAEAKNVLGGKSASVAEIMYWVVRASAVFSIIALLYFVAIH